MASASENRKGGQTFEASRGGSVQGVVLASNSQTPGNLLVQVLRPVPGHVVGHKARYLQEKNLQTVKPAGKQGRDRTCRTEIDFTSDTDLKHRQMMEFIQV